MDVPKGSEAPPYTKSLSLGLLQLRCRSHRMFVKLLETNVGLVVCKGPYKPEHAELVQRRAQQLRDWDAKYILYPGPFVEDRESSQPGIYHYTPCLFNSHFKKTGKCTYQVSEERNEKFGSKLPYRLVESPCLVNLSMAIDQDRVPEDINWVQFLRTWILYYLLEVGDTCLRNVFVVTSDARSEVAVEDIYHLDFDETLSDKDSDPDGPYFYLYHQPRITPFMSLLRRHYLDVIPLIPEHPRRARAVELLTRYASSLIPGSWFSARSATGCKVPVLISALQKYIRRGYAFKARQVVDELLDLSIHNEAIRTGMINRLAVIAAEDITFANIPLLTIVLEQATKSISRKRLYELVESMARSPKSRILSEVSYGYGTLAGRKAMGLSIPRPVEDGSYLEHLHESRYTYDLCWYYNRMVEDEKVTIQANDLWKTVEENHLNRMLKGHYKRCSKSPSESRNFFLLAYILQWWDYSHFIPLADQEDQTPLEERNTRLSIDEPWVHDQHTRGNADRSIFYSQGSRVTHQDPRLITPAKEIYHSRLS